MIYIFYPSKILGGAEKLLIRTANLLEKNGYEVSIIDIKDGWISKYTNNLNIKIEYLSLLTKNKLNDDDIIITTSNLLYKLDSFFCRSNAKVLLWTIQPYNVILDLPKALKNLPLINVFLKEDIKFRRVRHIEILKEIIAKNGIIAMDGECNKILYHQYLLSYRNYLPVFIDEESFDDKYICKTLSNSISVIWLGRIDTEFKIHILKYLLKDIEENNKILNKNIIFNIIGDGPGKDNLRNFIQSDLNYKVNLLGQLEGANLDSLIKGSDIGFAMGTSALEIAAKKIPTVLLDFSYKQVENYRYRWVYQTEEYVLGRDINLISENQIKDTYSLNEIFKSLLKSKPYLSTQCFNYVSENHSTTRIVQCLDGYLQKTSLTLNDLYKYKTNKPLWQRFNKVKNLINKVNL